MWFLYKTFMVLFYMMHNVCVYGVLQAMRNEDKLSRSKITDFASKFFFVILAKSVILRFRTKVEAFSLARNAG